MLDGFGWCRLLDAAKAVDAASATWPLLAGLAVLVMIRRQKPAGLFFRIVGVFAALVLFAVAISPRDPLTGQAMTGDAIKSLVVSIGFLLGLIQIMFPRRTE